MLQRSTKPWLTAAVLWSALSMASAQVAQEPLLNRPNSVAPNLTLIFDTSGSMDADYIYQYGGSPGGMGMGGPSTKTYAQYSPDVNKIYYDPRLRYLPRINYDGSYQTPNGPTNSNWEVYFRIGTGAYSTGDLGNLSDYYSTGAPRGYSPPSALVVPSSTASYPNKVLLTGGAKLPATTTFPKFIKRTDCVASATSCSFVEERQNHSNWKKWYSTRGSMAVTGMGAAFEPLKANSLRLGYGTIDSLDAGNLARGVASYGDTAGGVKDTFFTWMYSQSFRNSTPNLTAVRNVGQYYQRADSDGPWATLPNPASTGINTVTTPTGPGKTESPANHASCRRSFSMLITDGYSNGTVPTTAGNSDNTGFSIAPAVGAAFTYVPAYPYKDTSSNTMADLAMYYWGRDLRTDLANRVPVLGGGGVNNPSTWQNTTFYAVTLGIDGTLPQNAGTLASLTSGSTLWPSPVTNDPTTIDDLWHATINSRGDLLNASNASDLTSGLKKMFSTIAGQPQTLSGVAVSSTFLKNGTRKYKPEYVPGTWTGLFSAIALDPTTGNDQFPAMIHWQVEKGVDSHGDPISTIPASGSRNITTWNGSSGVTFNATNTGLSNNLVSYVRGDPTMELRNSGGIYRSREAVLGDIVNSNPVLIQNNLDLSYEKLIGSFGDYRGFIASKAARAEGVLFVGANDGMLHAFRDSDGSETFAFVPKAVVPKLFKLADSPYVHEYYVDGPNIETDAFLGGSWKNLLLGSTGAGGKAVYALDVTTPLAMTATNVLWEVNSGTTGFAELGNVMSEVQAGVLPSGDWVAIFGNGFDSTSGVARLYIVNLQTGALLKDISTGVGGGNGLGGVRVVRDANQRIVGAYAGDLKGNMWKFDLTGTSSSAWKVGLSGAPLYAAGGSQSITATPAVIAHPNGGYVVTFGTGRFFAMSDTTAPFVTQRLYGIWDGQAFGALSTPSGAAISGTTQLIQQTISAVLVGTTNYYAVSTNSLSWGGGLSGNRGWYIDLPNSGQRVVYPVERLSGTFVLASTISPVSSAAADLCVQTGSGSGWAYVIDGLTGSGPTLRTLDTNGDGVISVLDALVSGWQDPVDGRPTPITIESTKLKDRYCIVTAQNSCTQVELLCGQPGAKACPVPPIPGVKSREWRQLFMR